MYYKKYESERLYLSPVSLDDIQTYVRLLNDESLARGLGNFASNINEINEKEWIESSNKKGNYNFALIRKEDNKLIGNYGLEVKNDVSRRFHVGGFIGEEADRGKGYGTEALKLITKYAFEILNAETVFSGIYGFNEGSLKATIKAGYTNIGDFRDAYYYNGQFWKQHNVEITRTDYMNSKN